MDVQVLKSEFAAFYYGNERSSFQLFCSFMFPFYEGLQLKICIFLLTLKLPKFSPLNQGYQHDA